MLLTILSTIHSITAFTELKSLFSENLVLQNRAPLSGEHESSYFPSSSPHPHLSTRKLWIWFDLFYFLILMVSVAASYK